MRNRFYRIELYRNERQSSKIKREIEGMDRFVEEEMKNKITPIKNNWYDWLINYIPKPMRKRVSVLEDKFVFCKRNTPKQIVYVR